MLSRAEKESSDYLTKKTDEPVDGTTDGQMNCLLDLSMRLEKESEKKTQKNVGNIKEEGKKYEKGKK